MPELLSRRQLEELQKAVPILTDVWIYDAEVFLYDWLLVFQKPLTGEKRVFHNDNYAVAAFLDAAKPVLGGDNVKHYDRWILSAIYHGAENSAVKELSDRIIAGGCDDPWNLPLLAGKREPCPQFDLIDDISPPLRLKEIEGHLGMDIEESEVPFDLGRPLTEPELEKTAWYCTHDVEATVRLFYERRDYLASKITVGAMKRMTAAAALRMSNAKLTAAFLGARFYDRGDEFEYDFPANLLIDKYLDVIRFFEHIDPSYKKTLGISIAGVPHSLAWGGLHGALDHYREERTETRRILHIDVTSYYPSLMIQNRLMSRSAPDPDEYARVYERRVAAKKAGDISTANALKLVLNTAYGAMKSRYNALYDPRMANAVCISGQLYLIDLIEKLEAVPTFRLIQSNTDGLIVSCDAAFRAELGAAVREWETRTGFRMGFDEIEKIIQKDVNNYVMRTADGSVEVKGGYVSNFGGGDFQNRSMVVVAKAVVAALLDGVPPEQTVNACDDALQFQIVAKAGRTYDRVVWEQTGLEQTGLKQAGLEQDVQNVNRVFASPNRKFGTLYKIKLEREGQKARRDKTANLPAHCLLDNKNQAGLDAVDRQFYIDLAHRRIQDYLGTTPQKPKQERRNKKMAIKKTAEAPASPEEQTDQKAPASLGAKLMKLRETMDGFKWEKDGVNRHQSYGYITEKQYKNNFKRALASAGLDFTASMLDYQFIPNATDKMSMVIAKFRFEIIDRESGEREEYPAFGSGADSGDKGLYKAYTGAIKYFLANNFLVAEGSDPESDTEDTREEKPKYTPPARREEIRGKLSDQTSPATEVQIEAIANGIAMLEEAGAGEDVIAPFAELLETELTKELAESTIDAIGELLSGSAA